PSTPTPLPYTTLFRSPNLSADPGDFHDSVLASFLRSDLQDGTQQTEFGIADGELSCVNAHGDSRRTRGQIIARECPLMALIELAFVGERERMRGNYQASSQFGANVHQNFPSWTSK